MNDIDSNTYHGWANELGALEDQISDIQEAKKIVYTRIRKDYSKLVAERMKSAMRLLRMDDGKRAELMLVDGQARAILGVLGFSSATEIALTSQNVLAQDEVQNETWRDDRARERAGPFLAKSTVESKEIPHDPETSEILEASTSHAGDELIADNNAVKRRPYDPALVRGYGGEEIAELVLDSAA